jgi:DNA polymerase III delta subunit
MTLFHRWRIGLKAKPEPKQITWVCGDEKVLIEEVVNHVRSYLEPSPWNQTRLDASEQSVRTIKAELYQHPMGAGTRLIVIRHADAITDWTFLIEWLPKRTLNPKTYVVLVSDESAPPRIEPTPEERRKGVKPVPPEHIDLIQKRGAIIECRPFTQATAKYSIAWVQSMLPMRDNVARHLIERCNFQVRLARDTCAKLRLAGVSEVSIHHINQLLDQQPRDTYVDALLSKDHKTALAAARTIPEPDYGRIIGLLDSRLDLTGVVHDMMAQHASPGEIARAAGQQAFLVPEVLKVAQHYSAKRRLEIRKVLALADDAWRNGHPKGLLEVIASFW